MGLIGPSVRDGFLLGEPLLSGRHISSQMLASRRPAPMKELTDAAKRRVAHCGEESALKM